MKKQNQIEAWAKEVILGEAESIGLLASFIGNDFTKAVECIYRSKGRVIATGIGKSAIIAQKFVATLNSTGTPAVFMHAADAIHGDLGVILNDDVVVCLSKSGDTPEIKVLIPIIKNRGNVLVSVVSNTKSYLALHADYILQATVEKEACPNNLAPTSSTTAQLVICDAIAVCLLKLRGFTSDDFARFHPGGTLGKKLYMRVDDLYKAKNPPAVLAGDKLNKVILEITSKRMGAAAVVDENNKLIGLITDGDLRRMLGNEPDMKNILAADIMTKSPKTVSPDELAINAFYLMEKNKITQLVVCKNGLYKGMLHLHDILQEGIV
jgi:arabinose-5-phosphate isomerase